MATSSKAKNTPFGVTPDGKVYVKIKVIMNPLCALIDGLDHFYFKPSKVPYLDIDTAIEWCREESKHYDKEKFEKMIQLFERAKIEAPKNLED